MSIWRAPIFLSNIENDQLQNKEIDKWKFRLIFTTLLAIPLFVISMADLMPFYINIPFKISI